MFIRDRGQTLGDDVGGHRVVTHPEVARGDLDVLGAGAADRFAHLVVVEEAVTARVDDRRGHRQGVAADGGELPGVVAPLQGCLLYTSRCV